MADPGPGPDATDDPEAALDAGTAGRRIEALLEASATDGPVVRERSEELVRLVVDLYGAGLERLLDLLDEAGVLTGDVLRRLTEDDLVSGLLLVAGLHPLPVVDRVARALDSVRPYLGSHGGDVQLVEVTAEGVVRLRMLGSCDGCAGTATTVQQSVTAAVEAVAPEVTAVEVEAATQPAHPAPGNGPAVVPALIPAESLLGHIRSADARPQDAAAARASVPV